MTIDTPTTADRFAVGQTITLHGTATDTEDGTLPPSSLSWVVLRHHDTHTHPFLAPTAGNDVQITQPAPEDLGSGIDGYLEIQLTATDSRGVTTTVTRNVLPRKVDLTFSTSPAGRNVVLAGTTLHRAEDTHVVAGLRVRGRRTVADRRLRDALELPVVVGRRRGGSFDRDPGQPDDLHRDVRPELRLLRPGGGVRVRRRLGHDRGGFVGEGQCGLGLRAGVECGGSIWVGVEL